MTETLTQLSYLNGKPNVSGNYKQHNTDFIVNEDLGYELDNEGEHVFVQIQKEGCNTLFVAEQLAKFANLPIRSVGYAGLKDRNAVTTQYYGLHIPGKQTPDFSQFVLEGCKVLSVTRHKKKLRIGNLKGNSFTLVLRNISDSQQLETRLQLIRQLGVPNYFGEQRFGHDDHNLTQAMRWANGEIAIKDRKKRSFYLSAARSAIFNDLVSRRISNNMFNKVINGDVLQLAQRGSWFVATVAELQDLQQRVNHGDLNITAPMVGDSQLSTTNAALEFETTCINDNWLPFLKLFNQERLATVRRSIILRPQNFNWHWNDKTTITINFWLPAGCYATSVLRELIV